MAKKKGMATKQDVAEKTQAEKPKQDLQPKGFTIISPSDPANCDTDELRVKVTPPGTAALGWEQIPHDVTGDDGSQNLSLNQDPNFPDQYSLPLSDWGLSSGATHTLTVTVWWLFRETSSVRFTC
ncbi:MAG: hypothetical protein ACREJB_04670 [Planctomycetaceae bacterium]